MSAVQMKEYADTVLYNGIIYTIDSMQSRKQAIAIKGSKILYVGSNSEIVEYVNSDTNEIDLREQVVLPGFIDTHLHAPGSAYNELFNINLYNAHSLEETLNLINRFIRDNPQKSSYYGRGFNPGFFDELEKTKGPRKERLDAICFEKPLILTDFGGHVLWMNSIAFRVNRIDSNTSCPPGGVIELDPVTGELWGTLKEYAKELVPFQTFTDEEAEQAVEWFQRDMHRHGYTSVFALRPAGAIIPRETIFRSFHLLEKKGELKLRINGARDMDPNSPIDPQIEELLSLKRTYETELIKVKTAKFFADGVIEGGDRMFA